MRRVVVTGLGTVTALGSSPEELWGRICNGESGVGPITLFDPSLFRTKFGGEVPNWSPDDVLDSKEAKRMDRFAQFAVVAALRAVTMSGIDFSKEDPFRCGVILGTGIGGLKEIEVNHVKLLEKGPDKVSPFTIPKLIANAGSGQVSILWGLRGPNTTVVTACASGTNAIADAMRWIQVGGADVMITGGAEAALTPMTLAAFNRMKALSERNEAPTLASRPFDLNRDGFVLSEGSGLLVLEELEHAKRRGAAILAELRGFGVTGDGVHITQPDPDGIGAAKAMSLALESAGVNPEEVDYINAHGTSTPLGDEAETKAVKSVFGDYAYKVSISSTKSQLGHLLGASGGVEMVLSIMAMQNNVVPPTINYETPDPNCDLDYTPNQPKERHLNIVLSNSFGFGGHNATVIASRFAG